jgi:succinate dehydrogenase / fumarate reductase flavoprotein subunit
VYLDFADSIKRLGRKAIEERYGNLFQMYEQITGENAYEQPMRIFPAVHYTMGGLWVDYNLMSNIPGLHVLGEANFSDHGANRLGASALMQGLADGYFVIPATLPNYLATQKPGVVSERDADFKRVEADVNERTSKLLSINGKRSADSFHRELGLLIWDKCGMARTKEGLTEALRKIPALREEFWSNLRVPGSGDQFNPQLALAGRVADFLEFGELLCNDALQREESCGGHFRSEHQDEGEARRDDDQFSYVAAWEYTGDLARPKLHKEWLEYEEVHFSTRSYR